MLGCISFDKDSFYCITCIFFTTLVKFIWLLRVFPRETYFSLLWCEKFSRFWATISSFDVILWSISMFTHVNFQVPFLAFCKYSKYWSSSSSYLIALLIFNYFNLEFLYTLYIFLKVCMLECFMQHCRKLCFLNIMSYFCSYTDI